MPRNINPDDKQKREPSQKALTQTAPTVSPKKVNSGDTVITITSGVRKIALVVYSVIVAAGAVLSTIVIINPGIGFIPGLELIPDNVPFGNIDEGAAGAIIVYAVRFFWQLIKSTKKKP